MIAIKLYKEGIQTNEGYFSSYEEASAWLRHGNEQGWWQTEDKVEVIPAKTEHQEVEVQPEIRDEDGNVIQERVVEVQEVVIEPEQRIIHPATHTYEIVDITQELNKRQALAKRAQLRRAGEEIIDEIALINEASNISKTELKSLMTDKDVSYVRELLWSGSLESAKKYVESKRAVFDDWFTAPVVDAMLSKIQTKIDEII